MSIDLHRRGKVWYYRFQVAGRRIQRSTRETDKRRAEKIAREALEAERIRARGLEPACTMQELAARWLEVRKVVVSQAHWSAVETTARLHLGELAGVPVNRVTRELVEDERSRFLATHGQRSADLWLSHIKLLCRWAVARRMMEAIQWQLPKLRPQRKPKVTLPTGKVLEFLAAVDALDTTGALHLPVRLMLWLALRESEALSARWQWLDLEAGTYTPGQTKGREAQPLPVPSSLLAYLRPRAQRVGLMCPGGDGGTLRRGATARVIRLAGVWVGVEGLTPHRLRGSMATWMARHGVPVGDIQRFMRHKDQRTTLGYIEACPDSVDSFLSTLSARVSGGVGA